jgi:hypothetical protein
MKKKMTTALLKGLILIGKLNTYLNFVCHTVQLIVAKYQRERERDKGWLPVKEQK